MSAKSKIEWTDATWSPIRVRVKPNAGEIAAARGYTSLVQIATKMQSRVGQHCEKISPGCEHCYSEVEQHRCLPNNGTGLPFDRRSRDLVEVFLDEKVLEQPLCWKRPRRIFPMNQSDWCAEWVRDEMRDWMMAVCALTPRHTYQFLTKRSGEAREYCSWHDITSRSVPRDMVDRVCLKALHIDPICEAELIGRLRWPLPNVWLGVSVESKDYLYRIDDLRRTSAAVRFLSLEPLLEDLGPLNLEGIAWVICGGESGKGARPVHPDWVTNIRDQCVAAAVPFFFKQWGAFGPITCDDRHGIFGDHATHWVNKIDASVIPAKAVPRDWDWPMVRVGRKAAGRLLDGREWNEMPNA